MELNFYLNDISIDEPIGFGGIELSIIRDEEFHGIGFEASTGTLEFHGNGADILRAAKETSGIAASVIFRAEVICNAYQEEENIYTGRVNFGMYSEKCGDSCTVSVGVEEDSCIVTLRNRMDQKVDVDSLVAFDKQTALADYVMLGEEITLPGQAALGLVEGSVEDEEEINFSQQVALDVDLIFRPNYNVQVSNNLKTGNLSTDYTSEIVAHPGSTINFPTPLSPQFLFEESPKCFDGIIAYAFRMKGSFSITSPQDSTDAELMGTEIIVGTWDGEGDKYNDLVVIDSVTLPYSGNIRNSTVISGTFDESFSSGLVLTEGQGLYCYVKFWVAGFIYTVTNDIIFDSESSVSISGNRLCPATDSEIYMVHETLSRVTESITNSCARVKSEYYGRTESEPFAFTDDGCGGLRFLTSGLKIRRAEKDYFFASFQQLIDGLNAIDNIGFGIEDDPVLPNKKVVRVEAVNYFYQDSILLTLPSIPRAQSEIKEDMYYSLIKIGYKRWEVETINGLDEINSTRVYRTSFDTVNKTLEQESELVAGGYAIERTREQSFVNSGGADTGYDNEVFIVCVNRGGYNTFTVEVDEVESSSDVYSPSTKYNIRISPARNMMRWYKSTANGYVNISDTTNKIFFGSGTGNIAACIKMLNNAYVDDCVNEDSVLCENQDIHIGDFLDQANGQPIWKNETLAFEYPLSVADYRTIKAAPYGKIRFQCGQGEFEEGYIKEVKFRPVDGTASFTLIKKY